MTNTIKINFEAFYPLKSFIEHNNLNVPNGARGIYHIAVTAANQVPSIGYIREGYETLLGQLLLEASQDSDIDVHEHYALIAPALDKPHSTPITQDELVAGSISFDQLQITDIHLEDFDFNEIPAKLHENDAYIIYYITAIVHI